MRELIFVDTETTGLNPKTDELVELSWATMYGPVKTLYFGTEWVPQVIDDLIGFSNRNLAGRTSPDSEFAEFDSAMLDNTMVAANPSFDKAFLEEYDMFGFHYRTLDIETYAMAKLGLKYVPGMVDVYRTMCHLGYTSIPEPDHTSAGDVESMRSIYKVLRYI